MKPTFLLLIALAITPPLMAAKRLHKPAPVRTEAAPTNFTVTGADGAVKSYSIEVPASVPPPAAPAQKISQQEAVLAALGWAPAFYGSTGTAAISVDYITSPIPYYLVHLTGKVGDSTQLFYAAVLEDGRIVRPVAETAPAPAIRPAKRSKKKAA